MRWEMPTSSGGVFAHLYVWAIGAKKATPADIVACLKANPEACAEVLAACGHTTVEMVIDQRTQAERERDEARVRCESLACSLDEAVRGGKYYVKARVYGAIACEFRKTLQAFADRGEALAKAALEWRYSERNGVPVSAIETTGELLDAMTENGALEAKLAEAEAKRAACEKVVEAARHELTAAIKSAEGVDHAGPGSASFSRIFPEDTYPTTEPEADAFVKARMRLWLHTWVTAPMRRALDALKDSDSPVGVAVTAMGGHEVPAQNRQPVEPPSDPATGTTRREPPETDREDGSTGAVACDCVQSGFVDGHRRACRLSEPLTLTRGGEYIGRVDLAQFVTRADLDALEARIVERVRASAAEAKLAALSALIHTESGLDDHRYTPEQMVKEMAERWQGASDDCEKAEQALATVTAERDAAKYWLAAHKAASEALVDPVTGHGFFMLIGKGDDGADGWFYTFGGPLDSYTLCERSDDQDPHFVYFQRERYDHDRGCWIDGCEVVEPVLAPDECSVAPYCLEDVTEERDALKRERDEARAERDTLGRRVEDAQAALNECGAGFTGQPEATRIRDLRAKLAKTERVVEAARQHLRCDLTDTESISAEHALQNALRALDSPVGGSSVDPRPLCIRCAKPWVPLEGCDATVELCPACWYRGERPGVAGTDSEGGAPCTGQVTPGTVSGGASGAATPEGGHAAPTGGPMPPPEPAGSSLEATRDLQAPATRAELEELRREVLETVADVCLRADDNAQAPWPWPLTRLGAELRRRVERLEGG